MSNPQLTYSMDPPIGKLGMLYRTPVDTAEFGCLPAFELIQAGDLLEEILHSDGQLYARVAQSANGALKPLVGVARYNDARQPKSYADAANGYQIGELVSFVKRGVVFAKFVSADGTTAQVAGTAPAYEHSTTTNPRGAFTDKAPASTAGSEVDACPTGIKLVRDVTASLGFGVCLVDLNLP